MLRCEASRYISAHGPWNNMDACVAGLKFKSEITPQSGAQYKFNQNCWRLDDEA